MEDTIKFLIKINDFGNINIEEFKKFIYDNISVIYLNELNSCRLDGEIQILDIKLFEEFCDKHKADITLIYYSLTKKYVKKVELKYGFLSSIKSMFFNLEIENELMKGIEIGIKDFLFDILKSLLDNSNELSSTPKVGDAVVVRSKSCEGDLNNYCNNIKNGNALIVKDIDYKKGVLYLEEFERSLPIDDVIKLKYLI